MNEIKQRAIIVGSGPSAKGFQPPDNITVIAVNGAIEWLSRVDVFFTLDASLVNLRRMNNPRHGVSYYAAVIDDVLLPDFVIRLRRISERGEEPVPKLSPRWWYWRWSCVGGLSEVPGEIHSGNSAWGALGLAYHLGFTEVALIGIDGVSAPRIEGGRPNNLSHLPLLFETALPQINVVSCGLLGGIPKIKFEDWLNV